MCVLRIVSLTIKKLRYAVHDAVYCRVLVEGGRQEPKTFVLGLLGTTSAMYHCTTALFILSVTTLAFAFSALTLLVGRQEGYSACKN